MLMGGRTAGRLGGKAEGGKGSGVMFETIKLAGQHCVGNIISAKATQPTRPSRFIRLI